MTEPKYIQFELSGNSPSGKTQIWKVKTKDELAELLGWVKWCGYWRCYAFYPLSLTEGLVFEKTCLRDIADFLEEKTKNQRRLLEEPQK